ncbi:hypothetical protein [Haloferax sp. DFSO60]|uniref:hypothetical protein n=1 Tax=Haloferax sp. DFSO60 TaxID=3388652 RepID=UPI00397AA93B
MASLLSPTATTLGVGLLIAVLILTFGKTIYDEVRDGADSLALFSTVLFGAGGLVSLSNALLNFGDRLAFHFVGLVTFALGVVFRSIAWYRNDRNAETPV